MQCGLIAKPMSSQSSFTRDSLSVSGDRLPKNSKAPGSVQVLATSAYE